MSSETTQSKRDGRRADTSFSACDSSPGRADQYVLSDLTGEQAFLSLRTKWNELWSACRDATQFQMWNWQYLYWKHIIPATIPRILILQDSFGECCAIAPFVRTCDPMTGMTSYSFIGGYRADYNQILSRSDVPESAGIRMLEYALRRFRYGASFIEFSRIPAESWTGRSLQTLHSKRHPVNNLTEFSTSNAFAVALPQSINEYIAGLSPRMRRHVGYDQRRLAKECVVDFRVYENSEHIEDVIRQIESVDIARWGNASMYRSRSQRQFETSLLRSLCSSGALKIFILCLDGTPCAYVRGAHVGDTLEVDRIAYNPSVPAKLSVGKVANVMAIEACIQRGIRRFDLTRGGEIYKQWLGAQPRQLLTLRVHRSSADRLAQFFGGRLLRLVRQQPWLRNVCRKWLR